jgi:hypothetical protein
MQLLPNGVLKGVDKSLNNCAKPHPDWGGDVCLKMRQFGALSRSLVGGMIAAILVLLIPRPL